MSLHTVKLRQERARSSSKKDFLLRVADGCAFLTGARSSIRFDFLIAEGFVSRAPRVQKMWSDPLNYKSIVELEQIDDDDELALNELVLYDE